MRLKYLPFKATGASPGAGGHEGGSVIAPKPGDKQGQGAERPPSPGSSNKGILTVTLVRAFNLEVSLVIGKMCVCVCVRVCVCMRVHVHEFLCTST